MKRFSKIIVFFIALLMWAIIFYIPISIMRSSDGNQKTVKSISKKILKNKNLDHSRWRESIDFRIMIYRQDSHQNSFV